MEMQAETLAREGDAIEAKPGDLMGVRQCAAEIGVAASTISRHLTAGLYRNWGTDLAPKVSLAEVKAARAEKLNPAQQRQRTPRQMAKAGFHEARTAKEEVNRKIAELDLAERLGDVLDRREVEDDFETFARALRERMRQLSQTVILELEALPSAGAKTAHLAAALEQALRDLADEMESLADAADKSAH